MRFVAFDDFDFPASGTGSSCNHARALVTGVGEDAQNERPQRARPLVENKLCAVAILNVGGMDCDAQQKAKRVDEDVPLAARDFLRAIIALRIERRPPFGVPLTLWLSMMAAVGLASRPSCSRTATYNA